MFEKQSDTPDKTKEDLAQEAERAAFQEGRSSREVVEINSSKNETNK